MTRHALTNLVQCPTSPGWHPSRAAFHIRESRKDMSPMSENRNTSPSRVASGNISKRLRTWCHAPDAASAQDLMDEAAAEIERLRNGAADARETVCPHVRGTVTQHCSLNLTLTDEERGAIEFFADIHADDDPPHEYAATLRSLLTRLTVE